jgi:hypothetical protein
VRFRRDFDGTRLSDASSSRSREIMRVERHYAIAAAVRGDFEEHPLASPLS